jgi:hypothetical protein
MPRSLSCLTICITIPPTSLPLDFLLVSTVQHFLSTFRNRSLSFLSPPLAFRRRDPAKVMHLPWFRLRLNGYVQVSHRRRCNADPQGNPFPSAQDSKPRRSETAPLLYDPCRHAGACKRWVQAGQKQTERKPPNPKQERMVQMMVRLVELHPLLVLLSRFRTGHELVVPLKESGGEAAEHVHDAEVGFRVAVVGGGVEDDGLGTGAGEARVAGLFFAGEAMNGQIVKRVERV